MKGQKLRSWEVKKYEKKDDRQGDSQPIKDIERE